MTSLPRGAGIVCIDSGSGGAATFDGTTINPQCDGIGTIFGIKVFWLETAPTATGASHHRRLQRVHHPRLPTVMNLPNPDRAFRAATPCRSPPPGGLFGHRAADLDGSRLAGGPRVMGFYTGSRESYTTQDEVGRPAGEHADRQQHRRTHHPARQLQAVSGAARPEPDAGRRLQFRAGRGRGRRRHHPGTSDMVEVRFNGSTDPATAVADGIVVDCMGAAVAATVQSRNRFMVRVDAAGRPWLNCYDSGATWTALIPDVEAMEVLYGISRARTVP